MIDKNSLSKIGIGTWGIGGFAEADPKNDDAKQIDALVYSLNKGISYVETVYMYAQGKAVDILSKALKNSGVERERESVFITLSIYRKTVETPKDAENEVNKFIKQLNIGYIDSVQFTLGVVNKFGLENTKELIERLIDQGKTRYTSLTNSNLEFLKKYRETFGDKLFSHEGVFNFEVRVNEEQGLTKYAKDNNILNVVYQPLRRNKTALRNWPLIVGLANKYGKTQNQIILNWIGSKGFLPLVKSDKIEHIDENLGAFNFSTDSTDYEKLNGFKIDGYESPKIDWYDTGDGVKIHQLANIFDELHPNN